MRPILTEGTAYSNAPVQGTQSLESPKHTVGGAPAAPVAHRVLPGARLVDFLCRSLTAAFFLLVIRAKGNELVSFFSRTKGDQDAFSGLAFGASVGSRVAVILFLVLVVILCVVRDRPLMKAKGLLPRMMAIMGSFLISVVPLFPRVELGLLHTVMATLFVLLGTALSIIVLAQLGRSFSIMAEARRLVTSGPYAVVRHPLYLAEEIAVIGTVLQFLSPYTLVICAVHLGIQIQRMKNEEAVLRDAFPEYEAYQAKTARLIPAIY